MGVEWLQRTGSECPAMAKNSRNEQQKRWVLSGYRELAVNVL